MVGFFVAATVVTLVQFLRHRERRMLPLLALFVLLAWPTAVRPAIPGAHASTSPRARRAWACS
jgi:hypothetical protein